MNKQRLDFINGVCALVEKIFGKDKFVLDDYTDYIGIKVYTNDEVKTTL